MKTSLVANWHEYQKFSLEEKSKYLTKDGNVYSILFSQQFKRDFLDYLYKLTSKLRLISKTNEGSIWLQKLLCTKKVMFYFVQPSTRTFLSFQTACQTLGIQVVDVRLTETSSEMKGESFEDTIRTFSSYFDMIIMRHSEEGFAEKASFILNQTRRPIPVINAGSGKDQHPTQALLDIFTLRKSLVNRGGLENKTIMMCGDLKRGRTVRSLCYLLAQFKNVKFIFCSPLHFRVSTDIKNFLIKEGFEYIETTDFQEYLPKIDALYMTRVQDEYNNGNESHGKKSSYILTPELCKLLKPDCPILHPLPRREEINPMVDNDSRAMYWRQVRNGMWTRAALISMIFEIDKKILAY